MGMELLSFHNQLVPDFSPHDKDDNLIAFHIIQSTQIPHTQFKFRQRVGPQAFDCFGGCCWLVLKPGQDAGFQHPLVTDRQRSELPVGVLRDGDLIRHATASWTIH
jgi:hypothetical protein